MNYLGYGGLSECLMRHCYVCGTHLTPKQR